MCLLCGGFTCFASGILAYFDATGWSVYFSFGGKFFISMGFAIAYLYGSELFPTNVRGTAMSIQSVAARVGGILVGVVVSLHSVVHGLPLILLGIFSTVAGILILFHLPETLNAPLSDTVEEMKLNEKILSRAKN